MSWQILILCIPEEENILTKKRVGEHQVKFSFIKFNLFSLWMINKIPDNKKQVLLIEIIVSCSYIFSTIGIFIDQIQVKATGT